MIQRKANQNSGLKKPPPHSILNITSIFKTVFLKVFSNFQNSILHSHRWNTNVRFWYVFKHFQVDQGDINYQVESQFK